MEPLTSAEKGSGAFEGGTRLKVEFAFQVLSELRGALLTGFLPDSLRSVAEAASKRFRCIIEKTKCAVL